MPGQGLADDGLELGSVDRAFCRIVDRIAVGMDPEEIADIVLEQFTDDEEYNDGLCDRVQAHLVILKALGKERTKKEIGRQS